MKRKIPLSKNQGKDTKKIVQKGISTDEEVWTFFLPISLYRKKMQSMMNLIVFLFTYIPFFTKWELFHPFSFDFLLICKPNCPIAVFSLSEPLRQTS
jgi:hypothetical protein